MKLISLIEYVIRFDKPTGFYADQLDYYEGQSNAMSYVISYANFLKQKLELWMFVPCKLVDGAWVVLEEPLQYRAFIDLDNDMDDETPLQVLANCRAFKEAKDMVLFKGFEYIQKHGSYSHSFTLNKSCPFVVDFLSGTVEDYIHYNLELTPTAQKQIGVLANPQSH